MIEVLIHEIGHALGLKHPFEANGDNHEVLSSAEDQTKFTVCPILISRQALMATLEV